MKNYYLDLTRTGTWLIKSSSNPLLRLTAGTRKIPVIQLIEKLNNSSYMCLVTQTEYNQIKIDYTFNRQIIKSEIYNFY